MSGAGCVGRSGQGRGQAPVLPSRLSVSLRGRRLDCGSQSACLAFPRCPAAGGGWSHFIISPKQKEVSAPQSPPCCS